MTLQGTIHADSLQIQFSANDAVTELDRGGIELHRTIAQRLPKSLPNIRAPAYATKELEPVASLV